MAAYVIAQFDVNDIDMYYDYASKIFATLEGFGGKILAANDAEVREGSIPHLRTIVGEFPRMSATSSNVPPRPSNSVASVCRKRWA